ncbi:MAG TPA: hypothetical protein VL147_19425 [Devosia sp.]|nr:hypothetical protein [Devosia sp.]
MRYRLAWLSGGEVVIAVLKPEQCVKADPCILPKDWQSKRLCAIYSANIFFPGDEA